MSEEPRTENASQLGAELGARLRELRARHGLTQDQVAQRVGCHESAVSRWEGGSRIPTASDILALSELYRVSCDYLLGKTEQVVPPGMALIDQRLLDRLAAAADTAEFDRLIQEHEEQAAWLPVPEGAMLLPVQEAMRRAKAVAARHRDSAYVDRLFRPRG